MTIGFAVLLLHTPQHLQIPSFCFEKKKPGSDPFLLQSFVPPCNLSFPPFSVGTCSVYLLQRTFGGHTHSQHAHDRAHGRDGVQPAALRSLGSFRRLPALGPPRSVREGAGQLRPEAAPPAAAHTGAIDDRLLLLLAGLALVCISSPG